MNLVAKEYVAARVDLGGALVLSRFAGAADELRDASLVAPNDPAGLADAIAEAVSAAPDERRARMVALRGSLAGHDARRWGEAFLSRLSA